MQLYLEKDLIFCTSICQQINWLEKVYRYFNQTTMGVIFCCSVEEVKLSKRLLGFPLPQKQTTTSTTKSPPLPIARLTTPYDDFDKVEEYIEAFYD